MTEGGGSLILNISQPMRVKVTLIIFKYFLLGQDMVRYINMFFGLFQISKGPGKEKVLFRKSNISQRGGVNIYRIIPKSAISQVRRGVTQVGHFPQILLKKVLKAYLT